jgi:CheY-like chemotaxis protein
VNIQAYMVKPIQRDGLARAIGGVWPHKRTSAPASAALMEPAQPVPPPSELVVAPLSGATAGEERRTRVLLAEDVEENQLLVSLYLRDHAVDLTLASTGVEAVAAYERSPDFDLILMDIQMPEMDGYEATRMIRSMEAQAGIPSVPILALTAHALQKESMLIMEAGCDAHLTKPIRKGDLIDAILQYALRPIDQEEQGRKTVEALGRRTLVSPPSACP